MENLRLGASAVQHDMKREETVEEVEKNTELERQTPKRNVVSSSLAGGAKKMTAASHSLWFAAVFCCISLVSHTLRIMESDFVFLLV